MANSIVTVGKLLNKGLIKKQTKVVVDINDLKKCGFVGCKTAKIMLIDINELREKGLVKKSGKQYELVSVSELSKKGLIKK